MRARSGVLIVTLWCLVWLASPVAHAASSEGFPALALGTGAFASSSGNPEDVRMKGLETEVDVLKDKIFNSKARLLLLQETVLHGAAAGAVARIRFKNDMGRAYRLESASWVLDGQTIFTETLAAAARTKAGGLPAIAPAPSGVDERAERVLFDGAIVPGQHNLTVTLIYRGSGYQVFSYLEGYRFTVQSTYAFLIEEGQVSEVQVTAYPKDGFKNAYEDRLDVKFDLQTKAAVTVPSGPEARP